MKACVFSENKIISHMLCEILRTRFNADASLFSLKSGDKSRALFDGDNNVIFCDLEYFLNSEIKEFVEQHNETKVIVLINDKISLGQQFSIKSYGYIDGVIDNTYGLDDIEIVIKAAINGFQCFPRLCEQGKELVTRLTQLTRREKEILSYAAKGVSNKEIAKILSVSYKTVCVHRYNIMFKLKCSDLSMLESFFIF
ncbi:hypothetical protein GIX45_07840 [Erwinia sp. CPCC 100877]|nr:hypothetical protein [Erwinia sp. CPCC 100877]